MNYVQTRKFLHSRWLLPAFTGILIAFSYGSVTTRGGYADDFAFLAYSSTHSYLDAVLSWSNTFNSRISQGIMMPLFLKGLAGDTPGSINWTAFHAVGLAAFALSVFLLYRIMQLFNLPWQASITALLVFSLNPIKNEALLWPATIVGYIIPLCIFLLATWLSFKNAKDNTETVPAQIITSLLFLFCLFAIEQLFPLFILVIAMRLVFFGRTNKQLVITIASTLLLSALYILGTISGRTTERIDRFINIDAASITSHIINVMGSSLADMLGYVPRILLDPYFHTDLLKAGQNAAFMVAVLTLTILTVVLYHRLGDTSDPGEKTKKQLLLLFMTGALVYLAAMSPFMILSYYIAARALYIPSLGISLMAGSVFAYLALMTKHRWQSIVLTGSLAILLTSFVLVNIFSQKDFSRQWAIEQKIIDYIYSVRDYVPENTELSIFNVPDSHGPSPDFVNPFGFHGIVNWIIPDRGLYGETQNDFSDVFDVPENVGYKDALTIYPAQGRWVLAWTPEGVIRINNFRLYNAADNKADTTGSMGAGQAIYSTEPGELYGVVSPLGQSATYSNSRSVSASILIHVPQIDVGIVQLHLTGPAAENTQLRLIMHAQHMDGITQPYDITVSPQTGFHPGTAGYSKYVFLSDFSSIRTLRVSLTSKNENLSLHHRKDPASGIQVPENENEQAEKTLQVQFF